MFAAARIQVDLVASIEGLSRNISKEIILTPQGKSNYYFCYSRLFRRQYSNGKSEHDIKLLVSKLGIILINEPQSI